MPDGDRGTIRGVPVVAAGTSWCWADTGETAEHWGPDGAYRACAQCGRIPEECAAGCQHRHDPCLGHLDGAQSACCGHGIHPGYVLWPGQQIRAGWHANVHLSEVTPGPEGPDN